MSKLVDSFRLTDESGGGKKEIVFNLGDITAREWADDAKRTAFEARDIANVAIALAQSTKGPTSDYNINRVILACATMDSNTYPMALPDDAGFVLYLGYGENHMLTDIEIESNTGELHTLYDGYNSIFWNDYGAAMDVYVNFGVVDNEFVSTEDVSSTYFTFIPGITASEVSIALMRLFCLIHENNGNVDEALNVAYGALDKANEALDAANGANSSSMSLTTVDNVNRVILACASFGYYYEGGAYHSDDKPKKIPENAECHFAPSYNEDNTLDCLWLHISINGRSHSVRVYEGYNDIFDAHIQVNLKMYIDFGVVEKGIIAGEDITQTFKFTDVTVSETSVALMRLFSMANDAKGGTEKAISMTDESYYKGLAINDLLINRLANNNNAVPGIISKKIGEKYYAIDYEPISDSEVPVLLYDTSRVIMLNCSNLTTLKGLVANGTNNQSSDDIKEVTGIFAYEHLTGDALKLAFYSCGGLEKVQFTPNEVAMAVGSMDSMFASCRSLKYFNFEQMKFSSVNTCEFIFASAGLNSIVFPALPGIKSLNYAFHMSKELITLDMSNVDCSTLTKFTVFGGGEYNLVNFTGLKNIKRSYSIDGSSNLSHESALNCIAGLYDLTEGGTITDYTAQTLEFHPDVTAQLTEEEIAEATAKGWNIA